MVEIYLLKTIQITLVVLLVALGLTACATKPQICLADITHEYRLRLLPTFLEPVELLLQHDASGTTILSEFSYSGMGGYSPKRKAKPKVFAINESQWGSFVKAFHKCAPWDIPEKQPYLTGLDGCSVVFELREYKQQKKIYRWSPWSYKSEDRLVRAINEIVKLCPRKKVREGWLME